jgi:hypothetical protein
MPVDYFIHCLRQAGLRARATPPGVFALKAGSGVACDLALRRVGTHQGRAEIPTAADVIYRACALIGPSEATFKGLAGWTLFTSI